MLILVTDEQSYEQAWEQASNVDEEKLACRVARALGVHGSMPCTPLWRGDMTKERADEIVRGFIENNYGEPYTRRQLAYIRHALLTYVQPKGSSPSGQFDD